ncbi:MAG: PIN domain-containing protein [Candidatus Sumerlaeota bacterium]|nr:PIN domain-containing protein [Candidatus Sumerlaeota bacterium]
MRPLLLDTDVMVDFLKGYAPAVDYVKAHADQIILSAITIAELWAGAKGKKEEGELESLAQLFGALPISAEIPKSGGQLKRVYFGTHGVGLADALLAATAQLHGAELITLNIKHYPMFSSLRPPYVKQ